MSLDAILQSVDWNLSVSEFSKNKKHIKEFESGCRLVSVWNHELLFYDVGNEANPFLQEMKASLFTVPTCIALGLNKPAAASMRTAVESVLYYSYFSTHPVELATLVRNKKYFTDKAKIIDYHNSHSVRFQPMQEALGLLSVLNDWYGRVSAIIHGQIPGIWSDPAIAGTGYDAERSKAAVSEFKTAAKIINYWLLSTINVYVWEGLSSSARVMFLKGLTPSQRLRLGLLAV